MAESVEYSEGELIVSSLGIKVPAGAVALDGTYVQAGGAAITGTQPREIYVSAGTKASDANSGEKYSPFASIAAACAAEAAASGPCKITVGIGTFDVTTADVNGNGVTLTHSGSVIQGMGPLLTTVRLRSVGYTWGIEVKGAYCQVRNLQITADTGATVTYGVGVSNPVSAESCFFESVHVQRGAGTVINDFAVGPDVLVDISETHFSNCRGDAGTNAAFLLGEGGGNVLNVNLSMCNAENSGSYGVYSNGCNFTWDGGTAQDHTAYDFYMTTINDGPYRISGVRSEASAAFCFMGSGSQASRLHISDVDFHGQSVRGDGEWLHLNNNGTVVLENVVATNFGAVTPLPYAGCTIVTFGFGQPAPVGSSWGLHGSAKVIQLGYVELPASSLVPTAVTTYWTSDQTAIFMPSPPFKSGVYHMPPGTATQTATAIPSSARAQAQPLIIGTAGGIARIGMEVTLSGDAAPGAVADMVTNGTTTITSATVAFDAAWVGRSVIGTNLPANTYIHSVTNGTTAVLTNAATGSGSGGSLTVSGPVIRLAVYADNGAGQPGLLLLDSGLAGTGGWHSNGVIDGTSATVQEITVSLTGLLPGVYWLASLVRGVKTTGPTCRTANIVGWWEYGATVIPTAGQAFVGFQDNTVSGETFNGTWVNTISGLVAASGVPRVFVKAT